MKKMLLEQVDNDDRYAIGAAEELFESLMEESSRDLMDVLEKVKNKVSTCSTNKLFFTYIEMYDRLLRNLHAERLRD